jgi:hypothetical protein
MNTIEAIRNEIKRLEEIHERNLDKPMERGRIGFAHGVVECCDRILSFIDSLPEEPAPKGFDEAYLNECIAKASKTWEGVDVDKYMDEVRGDRPKLSDNSLEDEMINYWGRIPDDKDLIDTARHFALWQKEQMMDEWLEDRDGCFWDGVNEGKKAMKEQGQTKEGEVIEDGEFIKFSDGTYIDLCPDLHSKESFDFKTGDKVIVQIRKA